MSDWPPARNAAALLLYWESGDMRNTFGLVGLLGFPILILGFLVIALADPLIAGGLGLVLVGAGLVAYGLVSRFMQAMGMW